MEIKDTTILLNGLKSILNININHFAPTRGSCYYLTLSSFFLRFMPEPEVVLATWPEPEVSQLVSGECYSDPGYFRSPDLDPDLRLKCFN